EGQSPRGALRPRPVRCGAHLRQQRASRTRVPARDRRGDGGPRGGAGDQHRRRRGCRAGCAAREAAPQLVRRRRHQPGARRRWAQMRRRIAPGAYLGELLLNPVLWITLATAALWSTRPGRDLRLAAVAAAGVAVKVASDALVSRRLRGSLPRLFEVLLMPLKD